MLEVLQQAILPVNLVFTVMLLLVLLYWVMVILGALDFDFLDIDFDSDIDADADIDADMDFQGGGFLRAILEFFYIGEVPVMVLISIFALSTWTLSVLGNYYLNPASSIVLLIPIVAANLFVSTFVVKITGVPMRKLFKSLEEDPNAPKNVMGRICTIITTEITSERMGQGEVAGKGAPILLNVIAEADHVFHKGDEAVVIDKNKETGVYTVAPVDIQ